MIFTFEKETACSAGTARSARTDDVGSDVHSHVVPDEATPYAVPYKPQSDVPSNDSVPA